MGTMTGLPQSSISPLQRVQSAAARLVLNSGRMIISRRHYRSSTGFPCGIASNINCLMMHLAQVGRSPQYIGDILQPTACHSTRSGLRSASAASYLKPRLRTAFGSEPSPSLARKHGTYFLHRCTSVTATRSFKRRLKTYVFNCAFN
jgi:hypothetical protein